MKRYFGPLAVIVGVTLLLPWAAVTCVPGDAGMAACFVLFFAVNPLLALGMGVLAGRRREWWWPPVAAAMFLLGTRLLFAPGEGFPAYAGAYLALGLAAMAVTRLVWTSKKER